MDRLPNGLALEEMAGKLHKGQISEEGFQNFNSKIQDVMLSLITQGRDIEIDQFFQESNDFFVLKTQLFFDEIRDRALEPVYIVLNRLKEFMPEEAAEKVKDFIKYQLKLYHEAMSTSAIGTLKAQIEQTRDLSKKSTI